MYLPNKRHLGGMTLVRNHGDHAQNESIQCLILGLVLLETPHIIV
jgi:hypothetical protein